MSCIWKLHVRYGPQQLRLSGQLTVKCLRVADHDDGWRHDFADIKKGFSRIFSRPRFFILHGYI